jgi:hypothetical protein
MRFRPSWNGGLKKLGRIRRAFARGFWLAWLEVPPVDVRAGRPIMLTVDCDTTRFDRKIHEVLKTIMHAEQRAQRLQ